MKTEINSIPLDIIRNREFSPLQTIVGYLRDRDYNSKEIAEVLNRNISTINTTLRRIKKDSGLVKKDLSKI